MSEPKPFNPFYFLLAIVGVAFCVTASAFGLMTLRAARAPQAVLLEEEQGNVHPLMMLMDRHGMKLLMGELALLGVFTFAAIGTDQFRTNQQARRDALANKAENFAPPLQVAKEAEQGTTAS